MLSPPGDAGSAHVLPVVLQGLPGGKLIFQLDPKYRSLCQKKVRGRDGRNEHRCHGASERVTGGLAAGTPLGALIQRAVMG